ncbi:MAG TPA: glycosyltransferase [Thermomicrobiales bacterium]|nr:glycosyltransferase [Thermomicrobiales bacterium]
MLDLSVIVPVRNAEAFLPACLTSIKGAGVAEIVVVDGSSTDRTVAIARTFTGHVQDDNGQGVAAARMLGARHASSGNIALIDVDIVLPDGALGSLFHEFESGGYAALQAGLISTSGNGYWGRALVFHHNHGRSKHWPGVMATIFRKSLLLSYGLDEWFKSGEDIELRWRLQRGTEKLGVSRTTLVSHRFEDTFACALGQFKADGEGLARMVLKYKVPALKLLGIPAAGAVRGLLISLREKQPQYILYFMVYLIMNYVAMFRTLLSTRYPEATGSETDASSPSSPRMPQDMQTEQSNG